mmetsp:Transcript_14610/g.41624  ORF Transcript_14610/g.41624 Transcript_14610/m.41624 type:complete len:271 (+) Transcript_14610:1745-2557(+)
MRHRGLLVEHTVVSALQRQCALPVGHRDIALRRQEQRSWRLQPAACRVLLRPLGYIAPCRRVHGRLVPQAGLEKGGKALSIHNILKGNHRVNIRRVPVIQRLHRPQRINAFRLRLSHPKQYHVALGHRVHRTTSAQRTRIREGGRVMRQVLMQLQIAQVRRGTKRRPHRHHVVRLLLVRRHPVDPVTHHHQHLLLNLHELTLCPQHLLVVIRTVQGRPRDLRAPLPVLDGPRRGRERIPPTALPRGRQRQRDPHGHAVCGVGGHMTRDGL